MRKKIGISFIILGVICLLLSAGFVVFNHIESKNAEASTKTMLQNAQEKIAQNQQDKAVKGEQGKGEQTVKEESEKEKSDAAVSGNGQEEKSQEMLAIALEGADCIGILSLPVLELELPVLADWSYEKLKKAPCHYHGSCYESDFVIAAHNYPAHFGRLSELQAEDIVFFTDTMGMVHSYEVILLETLSAAATEEMITSGFDLSLYTCTPGGGSRVTVRCKKIKN